MEKRKNGLYIIELLISYVIFGSIGIFVRNISLSSALIAAIRGISGAGFIFIFMLISRKKISAAEIKRNFLPLVISGLAIGFNWILLFEAYRFTSIATATLCYYMAPVFVVAASPLLLSERLSLKSVICIAVSLCGMFLVSNAALGKKTDIIGILFGLGAALLYATAIICNKKMGEISSETRALTQLLTAGITVLPYALFTTDLKSISLGATAVILLITVGIIHTGLAYVLNLGSVAKVPAGTVAVLSYTDPIVAIVLEAVIDMKLPSVSVILGAALILGATAVSSLPSRKK